MIDKNEIYFIDIDKGRTIVYAPLNNSLFLIRRCYKENLKNFLNGEITALDDLNDLKQFTIRLTEESEFTRPKHTTEINTNSVVIILSQKCNLKCSYCYAINSRSSATMNFETAKKVIDFVFSDTKTKRKKFEFIGGGEPLFTFSILKQTVEYIKNQSEGYDVQIGITTNATLFNNEIITWAKENKIHFNISFEILKDIQDEQRPFPNKKNSSFDIVDNNIKRLLKQGFDIRIRSTITNLNVSRMVEMVDFAKSQYTGITRMHFEPVTDINEDYEVFNKKFVQHFFMAFEKGKQYNINITSSLYNSCNRLLTRHCNGEFCVTPNDALTSCHRVSDPKEKLYDYFTYGHINESIHIDKKKFELIKTSTTISNSTCKSCFAKWHCGGGCSYDQLTLTDAQKASYCSLVKKFVKYYLEVQLGLHTKKRKEV